MRRYTYAVGSITSGYRSIRDGSRYDKYFPKPDVDDSIPSDAGIGIEYNIPRTGNRIDMVIGGYDENGSGQIIIIELKQWSEVELTQKDAIVKTRLGNGLREELHPSYQAWSYSTFINGYNEFVYTDKIGVHPCAYMHNYKRDGIIDDPMFNQYIDQAPLFTKSEKDALQRFITQRIKVGDKKELLFKIESSELKPSKILAETVTSMLQGNTEFVMIDEQKQVYEEALYRINSATKTKKQVVIVHGGPGTGKSVIAINLLFNMIGQQQMAQYVSKNAAPRAVFSKRLAGNFSKAWVDNLFRGSGSFYSIGRNKFQALLVDEAHRLNLQSGLYGNLGENQVKEIINSAKCSVFFLDEDQKVTLNDIGSEDEIRKWATFYNADITVMELRAQFRCSGSDGYLAWLDNTMQIRETANIELSKKEYDFQVFDSPAMLRDEIFRLNAAKPNSARLVAGYCWNWVSRKYPEQFDIEFEDYGFEMRWNLANDGAGWAGNPESVSEVGCIHTIQGLEVEYVGVIIGDDLLYRNGQILVQPNKRAKTDMSIRGWKKLMEQNEEEGKATLRAIIKNTYKTLMSRGMKGCYVYCTDEQTREYLKGLVVE